MAEGAEEDFKTQDRRLTAAHLAGDQSAFAELYRLHEPYARGWAIRFAHRQDAVDDIVSESFARVLEAMQKGGGPRVAVGPYLITTIRNVATSRARELNKEVSVEDVELYLPEEPEPLTEPDTVLLEAFNGLTEQQQLVFWLRSIEELRGKDIARVLGVNTSTVDVRYYRAKQALTQKYLECVTAENIPAGHLYSAEQIIGWNQRLDKSKPGTAEDTQLMTGRSRSARDRRIGVHVEHCEHCQAALIARQKMVERFRVVVLLLPVSIALGLGSRTTAASATVASATATPGVILMGAAGVLVLIGLLLAGGVRGEPTRATPQPTATQAPQATEWKEVAALGGCRVVYVPEEGNRHLEVLNAGAGEQSCDVAVFHDEEKLGDIGIVGKRGIISAPRSGEYVVTVTFGEETETFRFYAD
ncbi:sigma-70 family RNA polymerase sigma factor [Leucobacter coleopterorum]|uniref:Sigma-70 family RNA polymerase sigma factor n=1 Tax=Leucobacter coleopterorum TaxID=2714933 RepID=A0ABX6K250_9MICO|nr:sigma-70 family RNA polymerase sigma factor [Leucobacter coleopterorum]QIM19115.1 sigma-70 family RNA polymerase sigma factor [Leucobacter coleopterorum]